MVFYENVKVLRWSSTLTWRSHHFNYLTSRSDLYNNLTLLAISKKLIYAFHPIDGLVQMEDYFRNYTQLMALQ